MILGEVEETITTVEIDDETYEEIIKVREMLFLDTMCLAKRSVPLCQVHMLRIRWTSSCFFRFSKHP